MTKRLFSILLLSLLLFSCSGRLVPAPAGMENAVKDYLARQQTDKTSFIFKGMSVREYSGGVYLINTDYEAVLSGETKTRTRRFLAEKATNTEGGDYWLISPASKEKLKTLGID